MDTDDTTTSTTVSEILKNSTTWSFHFPVGSTTTLIKIFVYRYLSKNVEDKEAFYVVIRNAAVRNKPVTVKQKGRPRSVKPMGAFHAPVGRIEELAEYIAMDNRFISRELDYPVSPEIADAVYKALICLTKVSVSGDSAITPDPGDWPDSPGDDSPTTVSEPNNDNDLSSKSTRSVQST